ncbi:MAG TPA: sigma-70 family RNA polymerase sigma factor [Draconibacterium sp.]|nr:sigma-70 family RNA polymerase sigma factor [Draconibacterium sp.]
MDYLKIIESIKSKEKKALESLYVHYGAKLFSFSQTNWGVSEDDSWDLVYKTLFKVVEVVDRYSFDSEKHFQNWIFKIFKNELYQYYRKTGNQTSFKNFVSLDTIKIERIDFDEELQSLLEKTDFLNNVTIESYLNQEETSSPTIIALEEALDEITDFEKHLLLLRVQGFTYKEVASFLEVENKDLKIKFLRAKKKVLKIFMKKMED